MKRTYQIIVAVSIVAIVCVAGAVLLLNNQDKTVHGTYSYGYESFSDYSGNLISEDGSTIDISDIDDVSKVVTLWDGDTPTHYDKSVGYEWLAYYVDFYCTPDMTIDSKAIHIMEGYYSDDTRYATPYIEIDGKIYHHENSELDVTLVSDGHGRITMIVLVSEFNPGMPVFDTPGIEWSAAEA